MPRRPAAFAAALSVLAAAALLAFAGRPQAQALAALIRPHTPFSVQAAPPAPDYANPAAWSAWPGRPGPADDVPAGGGAHDGQAMAKVDVFFIQPTTYLFGGGWNAAWDQGGITRMMLEKGVLPDQASAFNGCCRIFAPRYRQAALAAFLSETPDGDAALNLAYSDVLRAFDDYIAHENHGRPFIIAAHSQGSLHAMRLVQERVIGTPLAKRLVAVYAVGSFLPTTIEAHGLPVCAAPRQTGCIVDWNSVSPDGGAARRRSGAALIWMDGRYQRIGDRRVVCVNPLDWRRGSSAPAGDNLGALPPARGGPQPRPVPGLIDARCDGGFLDVDIPSDLQKDFLSAMTRGGVYHVLDYNLFYMNIRRNAEERAEAFLAGPGARPQ